MIAMSLMVILKVFVVELSQKYRIIWLRFGLYFRFQNLHVDCFSIMWMCNMQSNSCQLWQVIINFWIMDKSLRRIANQMVMLRPVFRHVFKLWSVFHSGNFCAAYNVMLQPMVKQSAQIVPKMHAKTHIRRKGYLTCFFIVFCSVVRGSNRLLVCQSHNILLLTWINLSLSMDKFLHPL